MRTLLATLLLIAVTSLPAGRANAQAPVYPTTVVAAPAGPTVTYRSYYSRPFTYSYYAALPLRAREYVGYGSNDFPFFGRAYGRPTDPWTWNYMSNPIFLGALNRYYYPPVP